MKKRGTLILFLFICLALTATAQRRSAKKKKQAPVKAAKVAPSKDTIIRGTTIEIIQNYTPEVKSTPKPDFTPTLPPVDNKRPTFNYDVPRQNLYYTYNALPLRPLALGREMQPIPFANYVKLGGGNLSTIYLDAGIGSLKGENYETAIHLKHLSQTGEFKDQKSSLTGLNIDGTLHAAKHAWHAALDGSNNQYHYYGYDHEVFTYGIDSLKQAFTGVKFGVDVKNEDSSRLCYHPAISASVYGDNFKASEQSFNLDVPVSFNASEGLQLQLGVTAAIMQFNTQSESIDNNIFKITPGINYSSEKFNAHAGIYPTMGKAGNYLLPDINLGYKIKSLMINAGWLGSLRQNTFEQLSTRNPFMYNIYLVQQTYANEFFGGIEGSGGTHFNFSGRLSWKQYDNMPLFVNDTSIADKKQFNIVYDKVSALSVQANVRYQVANTFSLGLNAILTSYTTDVLRHAWHEPGIQLKADVMFRPVEQLTITAYLAALDNIYALDANNRSVKLDPIADMGVGAEYSFIPRLSAFLQVNNLLNNKYQRWYGYTAYGLNVFGGLRLKF